MSSVLSHLSDLDTRLLSFTVDQYHRMIKEGILIEGAPYELISGYLVLKDRSARGGDPMTAGNEHAFTVGKIFEWNVKLKKAGCLMRSQQPISIPPMDEPEPDGVVVRGVAEDFRQRHPGPPDVICVIEVAESSLRYDRTTKLSLYAKAGIPMYLIVNLPDRVVEKYSQPMNGKYVKRDMLRGSDRIVLPGPGRKRSAFSARSILP